MLAYIKDGFTNPKMWQPVDFTRIQGNDADAIGYADGTPCRVINGAVEFVSPNTSFRKPLWADGDILWWTENGEWVS